MYTDGGSIPRIAQIFNGLSPWGFGPAYIVHDWIFLRSQLLRRPRARKIQRRGAFRRRERQGWIEADRVRRIRTHPCRSHQNAGRLWTGSRTGARRGNHQQRSRRPDCGWVVEPAGQLRRAPRHPVPYSGGVAKQLR
nr:DUF1353 domain-containing protein [Bradyrhizobium sediminis]